MKKNPGMLIYKIEYMTRVLVQKYNFPVSLLRKRQKSQNSFYLKFSLVRLVKEKWPDGGKGDFSRFH